MGERVGEGITHHRTAHHHPEGNSYIERFHRSLKEEEVWVYEYRSMEDSIANARDLDGLPDRELDRLKRKSRSLREHLFQMIRCAEPLTV